MPNLGDYVGQLMAELAHARFHADMESVRLAKLYAADPLLRHLAVPRFRLPTVTINAPVVVKSMEEGPGSKLSASRLLPSYIRLFDARLEQAGIRLAIKQREQLMAALHQVLAKMERSAGSPCDPRTIASSLTAAAIKVLNATMSKSRGLLDDASVSALNEEVEQAFKSLQSVTARLQVLVTAAELREAGPIELLPRLNMSIAEEAVEWSLTDSEEGPQERLIPE